MSKDQQTEAPGPGQRWVPISDPIVDSELQAIVPPPAQGEHVALLESLRAGQKLAIMVTPDRRVLDGNARLKCLQELGVKLVLIQVVHGLTTREDEIDYCIVINLHRRHLLDIQRVELGRKLLEVQARREAADRGREGARAGGRATGGRRSNEPGNLPDGRRDAARHDREASAVVAKGVGLKSGRQFEKGVVVLEGGTPEELEKVRDGRMTINEAYRRVQRRQRDATLAVRAAQVDESTLGGEVLHGDGLRLGPPNGTVDLVIVDPPFGVDSLTEEARGGRKPASSYGRVPAWNDAHAATLLSECMARISELLRDGGSFYFIFDRRLVTDVLRAALAAGLKLRNIVCWRKTNPPATAVRNWGNGFELVVYGSKGEPACVNVSGHAHNVIDAPLPGGADRTRHPCQKPIELLRRLIEASSNPGDLVVDFMAGSGSTGVAARELKRRFVLVEQDADYVTAIKGRLAAQASAGSSAAESA